MSSAASDILYIAISVVFFVIAASLARGCDRLFREE
jgi:hypothetical protein